MVSILLIPEDVPIDLLLGNIDSGRIVDYAYCSPSVGNGIRIIRVILGISEILHYIGEIRNVVKIERLDDILTDHSGDHVVRRDYNIVCRTAALQLCVKLLVGGVICIIDLDARELRELLIYVKSPLIRTVRDVLAPVVNVYCNVLAAESTVVLII